MQARIFGACPKGTVEVVENVFFRGHQSTELFSSVETCVCVCVCVSVCGPDTDECLDEGVCGEGLCVNVDGGFECDCADGYVAGVDGTCEGTS